LVPEKYLVLNRDPNQLDADQTCYGFFTVDALFVVRLALTGES
jgi:hypothetical protein